MATFVVRLLISTSSWKKDSFGLFDFECKELQSQELRHDGTGKIIRETKLENGDKRKAKITISTKQEALDIKPQFGLKEGQTALAKVICEEEGYWLYHSNKVDLTTMFSEPEKKLWLVVKQYNGALEQNEATTIDGRRALKLEKNSVIKMGRVRFRVRDIDYADEVKPIRPILTSPSKPTQANSPSKKANSASKLRGGTSNDMTGAVIGDLPEGTIDADEIKLIKEAQSRVAALAEGRMIAQEEAMEKREKKNDKKKHSVVVDADGNKILVTEEDGNGGRASPTKLTELSDEACCKICWGTEAEDLQNGNDMDENEPNPLISPCKCTGTAGMIHLKCLRSWLETKRQRKVHRGQVMLKFNKVDCEICK